MFRRNKKYWCLNGSNRNQSNELFWIENNNCYCFQYCSPVLFCSFFSFFHSFLSKAPIILITIPTDLIFSSCCFRYYSYTYTVLFTNACQKCYSMLLKVELETKKSIVCNEIQTTHTHTQIVFDFVVQVDCSICAIDYIQQLAKIKRSLC